MLPADLQAPDKKGDASPTGTDGGARESGAYCG